MTYSIVARDPVTGSMGVAVESHYFATGRVVTWAEAGVGAVATQAVPEVGFGPHGLAAMRDGTSASATLRRLVDADPMSALRQVAMIDAKGDVAAHTGAHCIAEAGHRTGVQVSVQANMMARATVPAAMLDAFEAAAGNELSERLMLALEAAEREGGDIRGRQSATMIVVSGTRSDTPWMERRVDLRVDDHPEPLVELRRLLEASRAFDRLFAVFQSGVLFAPAGPSERELASVLADLDATQKTVAPNPEPTFWQAVLLAKAGRAEEARAKLDEACKTNPGWRDLVVRLVPMGVIPANSPLLRQ